MADAIVWKHATESDLARLATRHSIDACKSDLAQIFRLDASDTKHALLLDFHQRFSLQQTSVLLGMCQSLMERDLSFASATDLRASFASFQSILLAHSVERSPKSVGVFSRDDARAIVDFVTHTYFRHLPLYQAIFTPFAHTLVAQTAVAGVEMPRRPRPLADGVHHIEAQPRAPQAQDDTSEH